MKLVFKLLIGACALVLLYVGGSFAYYTAKTGKTPLASARAAGLATAGTLSESDVAARLAKDPGDPVAHCALAEKAQKRRDFTKAIEIDANSALAYENRAMMYEILGETAKAEADLRKKSEIGKQTKP